MRRAGSDLKDFKSRGDYTEVCVYVCAESLMEELMHTYSCPLQGLLQPLPEFSPALELSVIQATKPCSAHYACGSQLLSAACGISTWQVQTSMLRWQGLGILWAIVSSLHKTVCVYIYIFFFLPHSQHCLLAFCQFAVCLCSWCYRLWSSVYCLSMSLSLDVFWDVSAWKIQHKYRT